MHFRCAFSQCIFVVYISVLCIFVCVTSMCVVRLGHMDLGTNYYCYIYGSASGFVLVTHARVVRMLYLSGVS